MTRYDPLVGKQRASVQRATAAGNLWEGAVRSSKTVCSLIRWLEFLIDGPRGELAMIGKTERTLKRNVIDPIIGMIGPRRAKLSAGSGEANILGRRIYLCGANDIGAVNKIAGMTLAGFYGDEIPRWPGDVFRMATTRTSIDGAQWFGTGNPEAKNHWLNRDYIQRAKYQIQRDGSVIERYGDDVFDLNVFSFIIDDNPSLSPGFVARLKRENVGVFYKRNILGEWCMAEGAIFAEWDAERNVMPRQDMPEMREWLSVGVDYGTSNPFHAGLLAIGPDIRARSGEALYLTDEYRWDSRRQRRQLSDVEYSAALRQWMANIRPTGVEGDLRGVAPGMVAVDPSAASFRVQCYRDGLPTRMADNEVGDSLRVAGSLIAAGKIIVAKECPALIEEIPGYVWDERAAKLGEEKPLKIDDHGIDSCLRYAPYSTRHLWHQDIFETPLLV